MPWLGDQTSLSAIWQLNFICELKFYGKWGLKCAGWFLFYIIAIFFDGEEGKM